MNCRRAWRGRSANTAPCCPNARSSSQNSGRRHLSSSCTSRACAVSRRLRTLTLVPRVGSRQTKTPGRRTPSVSLHTPVFPALAPDTSAAGDFFPPIFNCPHELDRLGALGDGGKWMCGLSRIEDKPNCVIYSFGTSPRPASLCSPAPFTALPFASSMHRRLCFEGFCKSRHPSQSRIVGLGFQCIVLAIPRSLATSLASI